MKVQLPLKLELHIPVVGCPLQQRARFLGESFICTCDLKTVDSWYRLLGMSLCCNWTWRCHLLSWCSRKQSCTGSCYTCTVRGCTAEASHPSSVRVLRKICGMSTASLSSILVWDITYVVLKDVHKIAIFPEKAVHYIKCCNVMYNLKINW